MIRNVSSTMAYRQKQMEKSYANRIEFDRPSKEEVFLAMACIQSSLSPDAQTKCGCIITTTNNRILGGGYNGCPRDIDSQKLPNVRPKKYLWYNPNHAERNAVRNCTMKPELVGGGIAYVTGECCFDCTCDLWAAGIETIYELIGFSEPTMLEDTDTYKNKQELMARTYGRLSIHRVEIDFTKNLALVNTLHKMGFVPKENK